MGRAEHTKKKILDSASSLFAKQGHGRTSVREIASHAKVNVALVSHHFGGKDKLYDACVERMYDELDGLQNELLGALVGERPLQETIADAVCKGFRYSRAHRGAVRLVMRHVLDTGEVPIERRNTMLLPFLDAASKVFAQRTGRTAVEMRLIIQSVLFLISRYALSSTEELALVVGCADEPEAWVLGQVEQQLARQVCWLLDCQPPG